MHFIQSNSGSIVRGALKEALPENAFSMWIDPLKFVSEVEGLTVHFPNIMHLEQFQNRYLEDVKKTLRDSSLNDDVLLKLDNNLNKEVLEISLPPTVVPKKSYSPTVVKNSPHKIDAGHHFSFDEFIVGPDNQMAYASCLAVAKEPSKQYNPLFLHGDTGLGKTHLLQSIANYLLKEDPHLKVVYTNCESFTNEFIEAIKGHTLDVFRNQYRNLDILVVDDIQFLADKRSTQEEFFHTFNDLIASDKQVIVSSDSSPLELLKFEDRLISRFSSGLVATIESPKFETRLAFIRHKCEFLKMNFDESVMQFLAQRPINNVRDLKGILITLNAHVQINNKMVTVDLLQELFPQYFKKEELSTGTVEYEHVLGVVTSHFKVRLQDIQSKKRPHSIAYPRQIAMYLLRKLTYHSLEEIGAFLGGRDHSTVQYAQVKIEKERLNDVKVEMLLTHLEELVLRKSCE